VRKLQQVQIGMTASQNLYTYWEPVRIEACRQADRWNAKKRWYETELCGVDE